MIHGVRVVATTPLTAMCVPTIASHATAVLRECGVRNSKRCLPQCHIQFVCEAEMARLSAVHNGARKPTDVLAFPAVGVADESSFIDRLLSDADLQGGGADDDVDDDNESMLPSTPESSYLGELFVCPANILRRLRRRPYEHVDRDTYFLLALTHGLLHLCGYRHETDADHAVMRAAERHCARALLHQHLRRGSLDRLRLPIPEIR